MELKLEKHKDYILSEIDKGRSIKSLAEELNAYHQNVSNLIKKYRPDSKFTLNPGNLEYFRNINTDKKAYFVGFIAADGALVKTKTSTSLTITIHSKDRIILDSLKEDIGCDHEVKKLTKKDHVRFVISRKEHIKALNDLGIESNKSLTMPSIIHNIPKEFRKAFLRGYFDGDGSIFKTVTASRPKGRYYVSIRGTEDFLNDYIKVFGITSYSFDRSANISGLSIRR